MERCYQYYPYGLPYPPMFLMLLKAFTDSSAAKVVKAQPTPSCAPERSLECRPPRRFSGRDGSVGGESRAPQLGHSAQFTSLPPFERGGRRAHSYHSLDVSVSAVRHCGAVGDANNRPLRGRQKGLCRR